MDQEIKYSDIEHKWQSEWEKSQSHSPDFTIKQIYSTLIAGTSRNHHLK